MSRDFDDDDRIRSSRPERSPRPRRRDDNDGPPPVPRPNSSGTKTVLIVLGIVALVGCCVVSVPVGFFAYFGYRGVSSASEKVYTTNNHKIIALGMANYMSEKNSFPPQSLTTRDGKPGLSWRVAILPYIEHDSLYKRFKLDEPWDSSNNRALAAQMPLVYAPHKGAAGELTQVRLVVGPKCVYDPALSKPRGFAQILDGMSNTILFVEAEQPVIWTKPDELAFDPKGPLPPLGLKEHDYFLATFCDGSVRPIKKNADQENLKKAFTAVGGEMVDMNFP
jgi:hypothetical protein